MVGAQAQVRFVTAQRLSRKPQHRSMVTADLRRRIFPGTKRRPVEGGDFAQARYWPVEDPEVRIKFRL